MLYLFGFDRVGVVLGDLYFVDPEPGPGQEGPEHGVRLEVRLLEQGSTPDGTIYASRPITVGKPIWRADLLESVAGATGSFDRVHHHAAYRGWEPGGRSFDPGLSEDPVGWVGAALSNLPWLLKQAEMSPDDVGPDDERQLAAAVPEIKAALRRLIEQVQSGELAAGPATGTEAQRVGWL